MPYAAEQERDTRGEQQVGEDGADDGRPHHVEKPRAFNATSAMINSGAFPNVALSNPPMASPVRVARCSVDRTIKAAMGMMASAAEKNSNGAGT
jgi:hypothetical protein